MTQPSTHPLPRLQAIAHRALVPFQVLLLAQVAAFGASTLGSRRGYDPVIDGWLKGSAYATCAIVAGLGAFSAVRDRRLWSLVAAGVALRSLGFVVYVGYVRHLDPTPQPSLADIWWLLMYVPMVAALVQLIRTHFRGLTAAAVLEAAAGMVATAALLLTVLPGALDGSTASGLTDAAVATNALYPVLDSVLLVLTFALLIAYRGRAPAAVWLLAAGVISYAVIDSVFLHQMVQGTFDAASPLSAWSLAASATIAWTTRLPLAETEPSARIPGVALPRVVIAACIAILGVSRWTDVPPLSMGLAIAGMLLALGAVQLTQHAHISGLDAVTDALRASERQLAEAQRISHTGSVELSLPEQTVTWSTEMTRILGLDPATPPSVERLVEAIHPDDLGVVMSRWAELIQRGTPFRLTYRIRRADGEERWVRGRGTVRRDGGGSIVGATGTFLDDTERITAEKALRAAERRFVLGFEQGRIAAAMFDLDGKPKEVNQAMCDFLQRSRDELLQHRWIGFSHPDELPMADQILNRLRRGLDSYEGERRFVRPDGSIVWASGHLTLMRDDRGEPEYLLAQLADISELKRLEADRRTQQRRHAELLGRLAEAEDLERDRIARDIHDDTIQRMAGSSMLIEAVRRGIETGRLSREELIERLAEAGEAVMVATEGIRDVVYNLATPEVSAQIVDATTSLADWLFSGTDTRAEVVGDPGPLDEPITQAVHRIIAEALRNVRRHAQARSVMIRFDRTAEQVTVSVADDGISVPAGGPARSARHFGVRTMLERAEVLGGSCTIEPGDNGGTVVTLRFPVRVRERRRYAPPA